MLRCAIFFLKEKQQDIRAKVFSICEVYCGRVSAIGTRCALNPAILMKRWLAEKKRRDEASLNIE